MVVFPIDKYLAQDYRNVLRTGDAPQNLDTDSPIIPVVDIQKGFPKPNSKQRLRHRYLYNANSTTISQIATPTNNLNIYYIGFTGVFVGVASIIQPIDATSGGVVATDQNEVALSPIYYGAAAQQTIKDYPILPIKCDYGLRFENRATGVGCQSDVVIYWIEEVRG